MRLRMLADRASPGRFDADDQMFIHRAIAKAIHTLLPLEVIPGL